MKKKRNKEELKEYLFAHPLFAKINENWPARNLEMEFELMIEHHLSGDCRCHPSGALPVNIVAAWKNWIPYTQPDPKILAANSRIGEKEDMIRHNVNPDNPPLSEKGIKQLDEIRERFNFKKNETTSKT